MFRNSLFLRPRFFVLTAIILSAAACREVPMYEKLVTVPGTAWQQSFQPEYSFLVKDTSAAYRIYVVLRHTNEYPYRNIWMNVSVRYPGDSAVRMQQFELPLASGEQWLGTGMMDVYERRVLLLPDAVKFKTPGTITFTLQHNMRQDPLPHVLQAGIRVEPAEKQPSAATGK